MSTIPSADEPIFTRDTRYWHPHPEAAGPRSGLHGGAISGLLVADMEREARELGLGLPLSASVLFIRPGPLAPLETHTEVLRKGGRVGVLEATLLADGQVIAKGTASFVVPRPVERTPAVAPQPYDPADLPHWELPRRPEHKTLFDALDIRDDGHGTKWARLLRRLVPHASPFANLFAVADNGTPFYLTAHGLAPFHLAFPNIDLAIHVSRAPIGEWIGVTAQSDWRLEGMGLTESALYDEHGLLGRACQTVVLVPRA
jgi:acyl-CoA thioesterase